MAKVWQNFEDAELNGYCSKNLSALTSLMHKNNDVPVWNLQQGITESGNRVSRPTQASSNKINTQGFNIIHYTGPTIDANGVEVIFWVIEYSAATPTAISNSNFIKRTQLKTNDYLVLDSATKSIVYYVGRIPSTGITITQDDVDYIYHVERYSFAESPSFALMHEYIAENTDINTKLTPGQYRIGTVSVAATCPNWPLNSGGLLYVFNSILENTLIQMAVGDITTNNLIVPHIFYRQVKTSGEAGQWGRILTRNSGEMSFQYTLTEADDCNDLDVWGIYRVAAAHIPANLIQGWSTSGLLICWYYDSTSSTNLSNRRIQTFITSGQIFQRFITKNTETSAWDTWHDWEEIASSENFHYWRVLTSDDDLNDITRAGTYTHSSDLVPINVPFHIPLNSGMLACFTTATNGTVNRVAGAVQLYYNNGRMAMRYGFSTGWQPWTELATTEQINFLNSSEVHNIDMQFTQGAINSSTGTGTNSTTRVRSSNFYYVPLHGLTIINPNTDFKIFVLCYDKSSNYLYQSSGWLEYNTNYTIPTDAEYLRFVVAYNDNSTITPSDFTGEIHVSKISNSFTNYSIPTLYLTGNIEEMSKETSVNLDFNYLGQSGTCKCKWQGSSSVRYPKKNYTISKLTLADGDTDGFDAWILWSNFVSSWRSTNRILNTTEVKNKNMYIRQNDKIIRTTVNSTIAPYTWGKRKKYCLKANWIDPSAARNVVSARLWGQIVRIRKNPIGYLADVNNGGAIDGYPCFVNINGENKGLYTFNTPKDEKLFNMGNGTNEWFIVGEINEGTSTTAKAGGWLQTCTDSMLYDRDTHAYAIEYPDIYDDDGYPASENLETFSAIKDSLNNAITAALNASSNWETTCAPYIDIDSVIDYYIFACCIGDHDGMARNIIYGTYDGVKWFMSAYDLDTTFGSDPYGSHWFEIENDRNQFAVAAEYDRETQTYTTANKRIKHRLFHLVHKYSREKLIARYKELRKTVLSDDNIWYEFSNFINFIEEAHYRLDREKWPTMIGTTTANMHQYVDFYKMHCKRLDEEIAELEATLNS